MAGSQLIMFSKSSALGRIAPSSCRLLIAAVTAVASPVMVAISPAQISAGPSAGTQASGIGAARTAVRWSITPQVGRTSGAGVYTAPASTGASHTGTATPASVADPTSPASTATILSTISVTPL